mmetsp:Transcript_9028/g.13532  ORF Transcript_9028/g.13532 Transcript_9028/m.13532 type:complete len:525 (+) Transcript_9028:63-1637(+)
MHWLTPFTLLFAARDILAFTAPSQAARISHSKPLVQQLSLLSQSEIDDEIKSIQEDLPPSQLGAWIPLGSVINLADVTPLQLTVCGLDLVVWNNKTSTKDSDNYLQYSAFVDACPHRLAPLSQGRINPDTGCLECPYHGWQFDNDGALANIPQLDDNRTIASLKQDGGATSLPVHAAGDLLFVFIPSDVCGESWPIERLPESHYPFLQDSIDKNKVYYMRDLPYSADMLLENFFDPAHIPFAHHSLQGTRDDAVPIEMKVLANNFTHVEASFLDVSGGKDRDGVLSFQRPAFYHYRTKLNSTSTEERANLLVFVTPVSPGKCRIMMPEFIQKKWFPPFLGHAGTNRFLNSDTWLHDTERNVRTRDNPINELGGSVAVGSARAEKKPFMDMNYIFASKSDMAISAFRKWWSTYLSESPVNFYGKPPASAFTGPALSRAQQIDPWENHAKYCSKCRQSLRVIRKLQKGCIGLAASTAILLRRKPIVAIASVFASLWMKNFLGKVATLIEGNNHRSEIGDRSVAAMK